MRRIILIEIINRDKGDWVEDTYQFHLETEKTREEIIDVCKEVQELWDNSSIDFETLQEMLLKKLAVEGTTEGIETYEVRI